MITKQSKLIESIYKFDTLLNKMLKAEKRGLIKPREEDNRYLITAFSGVEPVVTNKWNIKFFSYSKKKGGHSVVCNDWEIFDAIISEDWGYFTPPNLPVISIDDAGWGFPLCGVMVGISDGEKVLTETISVDVFRGHSFKKKEYLMAYKEKGFSLLEKLKATPQSHRIEICTGYLNIFLREALRIDGFNVKVVEIKGLLQDELEDRFKDYVKDILGKDIYCDPKEMEVDDIPLEYHKCVEFGKKHFPNLLKTGWKSLGGG